MFPILFLIFTCLIACSGSKLETGTTFQNEAEFKKLVTQEGFLVIGSFNLAWPAAITSIDSAQDSITLQIPQQSPQDYQGYSGYDLKALTLKRDDGQFSGFVLRSKEKR